MNHTVKIDLDDGKYTYVLHADGRQHALRHGELWRDLVGDKFVYSLAARAEELREQNEKLLAEQAESKRLLLEEMARGNRGTEAALQVRDVQAQLVEALKAVREHAGIDGLHIGDERYLDTIVDEALAAAGVK